MVLFGAPVAALPLVDVAEVMQGVGLALPVCGLTEQGERLVEVIGGLRVAVLGYFGFTEASERIGFTVPVPRLL